MGNLPGEPMTQTKLPAYLAFAPAIFLAVIMAFVYMASQFVFEGAQESLTIGSVAELEKRVNELASEIVTEAVKVIEHPPRRQPRLTTPDRKEEIVKRSGPSVILDFAKAEQAALLEAKSSPDMKATFLIDSDGGSPNPVSAKLLAVMIERGGKKSFASGRISLPEPVPVGERKAFVLHLKGDGLKAVRIAALERIGDQYIIWEKRDVPVGEDWAVFTIPFADCDIWMYDSRSHKYTRPSNFPEPKNITGVRALVQPAHLTSAIGMLWIDSISLK